MRYTVECVPNFSEGRDEAKVQAIVEAVLDGKEVAVLDSTMDPDHNRSVITLAGSPVGARDAALRAIGRAVELIDLTHHSGVHPRIGAADVVPFVPLEGSSLNECAALAKFVASEAWVRYELPTYLYGYAAQRPDRRNLETIRRGQFEGLREEVKENPNRLPDFGVNSLHPSAGATAVGARNFLIAFNINLKTTDAEKARSIARKVRASGGGLAEVKALGLFLPSRNLAQVSLNLADFRTTSLGAAFDAVEREAQVCGEEILESELVGLIPQAALDGAPLRRMRIRGFNPDMILENRLQRCAGI
ncbi:MAG: glutamate formimidoyltransferase [Acidobacteriota bacterium]|nr:glutamate formimidoyltransferase [Acidobacteriota bacterium]